VNLYKVTPARLQLGIQEFKNDYHMQIDLMYDIWSTTFTDRQKRL